MKTYRQRKLKQQKRVRRAEIIARHESYDPYEFMPEYMRNFAEAFNKFADALRLKSWRDRA